MFDQILRASPAAVNKQSFSSRYSGGCECDEAQRAPRCSPSAPSLLAVTPPLNGFHVHTTLAACQRANNVTLSHGAASLCDEMKMQREIYSLCISIHTLQPFIIHPLTFASLLFQWQLIPGKGRKKKRYWSQEAPGESLSLFTKIHLCYSSPTKQRLFSFLMRNDKSKKLLMLLRNIIYCTAVYRKKRKEMLMPVKHHNTALNFFFAVSSSADVVLTPGRSWHWSAWWVSQLPDPRPFWITWFYQGLTEAGALCSQTIQSAD